MAILDPQRQRGGRRATGVTHGATTRPMVVALVLTDACLVVGAVLVAWRLRAGLDVWALEIDPTRPLSETVGPWIIAAWIVVIALQGGYSTRFVGGGTEEFKRVLTATAMTAGLVGLVCYLLKVDLSRGFVLLTFLVGGPLLLAGRVAGRRVIRRLRLSGLLLHRTVVIGSTSAVSEVVEVLRRERHAGYEVAGACVPPGDVAGDSPVPVLGDAADVVGICRRVGADTVLVVRGGYGSSTDLRRIAWRLQGTSIDLIVVPSLTDVAGPRVHVRPVGGLPLLHVEGPQSDKAGGLAKRAFDVALATGALLALTPVLVLCAVLMKVHDGGPVFFRQERVGRDGTTFGMLKLRSMVIDAESRLDDVWHLNQHDGPLFKCREDPRVTPLGRFIRRFSIDEIPQLVNVLRGEMSLVGPRPPLPSEVARYGDDVRRRLLVRPGMTGLWQVSGRSSLTWNETVRLDLYYVDNWSMVNDLVIMTKTARAVFGASGAY